MDKCLSKLTGADSMNFVTHNERENLSDKLNMSSLQGEITATYKEICSLFGKPIRSDNGKTDVHWYVEFSDGTVANIYNWKNGKAYLGELGLAVEKITDWHVGGFSKASSTLTQIAVDLFREKKEASSKEDPFDGAFSIMENLVETRGESYAALVELATLVIKRKQLFEMVLDMLKQKTDMPSRVSNLLEEMDAEICSRTISRACQASNIDFDTEEKANELMEWAAKLVGQEVAGIHKVMKTKKGK